jgi:pimeloyl-ACP methyl ester carboxylesterase
MNREGYLNEITPRLHYTDRGTADDTTLVLLHGLQDCAANWDGAADRLADRYRVITLDLRGHGDSEPSAEAAYSQADFSNDIGRLLNGLDLGPVVLVGHSYGGNLATAYASANPDRIAALVVVDSDIAANSQAEPEHAYAVGWRSLAEVIDYLGTLQPYATTAAIEHQATNLTTKLPGDKRVLKADPAVLETHVRTNMQSEWSRLHCPALVLRGRASAVLGHKAAVALKEALSRTRIAELEEAGHWPHQEVPGAFDATLRWFLNNSL